MVNKETSSVPQATTTAMSAPAGTSNGSNTATAVTDNTTPPPVRRHSLVHRHSSAAYAMEHAPILTHPALDTADKPPLPPRTYKSSGSGSTDSLSSDSCSPAQNKRCNSNNVSNTITSDSEPEETFIPLAKPSMRFKVDVTQWKVPYSGVGTSSSNGLRQTSIPEEHEMVSQSSPPPLPPKPPLPSDCTCTCHHHHHPA